MDTLWNLLKALRPRPNPYQAEALSVLSQPHDDRSWLELSRHRNGHIREGAVRHLALSQSPEHFVALVERLNDWVAPIREQASLAIRQYLHPGHAAALLAGLKPLIELAEKRRADHSDTLAQVRETLLHPQARTITLTAFDTLRGRPARFLFELFAQQDTGLTELLTVALAHSDVSVRSMAMARVSTLPDARNWALRLLGDSPSAVRLQALRLWMANATPTEAQLALQQALYDNSASVLDYALWAAQHHGVDARTIVRERLSANRPHRRREWTGLLILVNAMPDLAARPLLTAAARSSSPRVRELALSTLAKISPGLLEPEFLQGLEDESDRVFNCAASLLQGMSTPLVEASIDSVLGRSWGNLRVERRQALLHLKPHWRQADWLLQHLLEDVCEEHWQAQLQSWCDNAYATYDVITPKDERERIKLALQRLEDGGRLSRGSVRRAS